MQFLYFEPVGTDRQRRRWGTLEKLAGKGDSMEDLNRCTIYTLQMRERMREPNTRIQTCLFMVHTSEISLWKC